MRSASWQESLQSRVGELRAAIEQLRESFEQLGGAGLAERVGVLDGLVSDLERACERARPAGVVALVGPTGAGKSSLFNALCGHEVSTVGVQRPTTASLVVAESQPGLAAELLADRLGALPAPHPLDTGTEQGPLVLVDGPDHNTGRGEHRETSILLAEQADLLVVVVHAQGIVELSQLEFLAPFLGRRRVLGVLGHADELDPAARTELVQHLAEVLEGSLGRPPLSVVPLDLRRKSVLGAGASWSETRASLLGHVHGAALERLLESNALGCLGQLVEEATELEVELRRDASKRAQAWEGALATWREALVVRHMERVSGAPQAWQELTRCAVARGMGGLAGALLRASWAQLGAYLAGALLLRRSPIAGAGAVAGGLALGGARGSLTLEELSEEELADVARLVSGLALPGDGAGVGEEDSLAAWQRRTRRAGRDGLESWRSVGLVSRVSQRTQRALLEVPLVLLAVRAVVLAAAGVVGLSGSPGFGVNGLIDSLLLSAAWMGIWRLSAGCLARVRAEAARRSLEGHLSQAAQRVGEEVERDAVAGVDVAVRALRSLAGAPEQRAG